MTGLYDTTVRLAGINTPDQGECYVEEGLDHLIDTLKGRPVTLEILGIDQFGRTLAHVFDGDRHVNLELVALGLAIASGVDDDPYGTELVAAEGDAHESGVGLWGTTACGASEPSRNATIDRSSSVVDPQGPDDEVLGQERIQIVNGGSQIIDLSGWILRDESARHRYLFPPGSTLAPGQPLTISSADPGWDPGGSPVWNNGGDMALLQLPNGTVVDRWRY